MKKLLCSLVVAILLMGYGFTTAFAQQQMPPIPVDPNVRIGKLDNGLTYYIRKNSLPANRADFYIAQKVGSIQETAEQKGLAHFLEHMCFNGTKHFPGNSLTQYLESIGVRFGGDLNAYTSVEETVYNINNVPINRESVIDSCLLILRDWSNDLLLDPKEIDKERGVIHEEWRSRMSAMQRLQEKAIPQMFAGTRYEDCFPIGKMDIVLNFKPQTLRDYYEMWYRPDLQGIVVVGDVDVDRIEEKIKAMFADIPAQPNAPERIYYPVNDNTEPIVVIGKDKEQPNIQILLFNKHDATPDAQKVNMDYMIMDYLKDLISSMLNARLEELRQTANPPYIYAGAMDGNFFVSKTKDAYLGYVICKEDDIEGGFETLLREIERARRFGFTETEYSRARAEVLRLIESEYNERDKKRNDHYTSQYVHHFLDNEPIPGIENLYSIINQVAPAIPVEAVNQIFPTLVTGTNRVVAVFGPEKEGLAYPAEDALKDIINKINSEELTAYIDQVSDEPLMAEMPAPGKVVSEKKNQRFGTTELTLSNGVKVIIKPTDFKADEIIMTATSFGGSSLYPPSDMVSILNINSVIEAGGIGNFSPIELEKVLAGKKASVSASVNLLTEDMVGSCSPKDLETMLQLTYLTFTSPRKDENAFTSYKNRMKASLQNQEVHPMVTFVDSIRSAIYMNHPRTKRMKADMVDQIDYDNVLNMYKDRFKDAGDFTFIFIGNIDVEEVKPLIEQYIGALPSVNREETFADVKLIAREGVYKNEFFKEQEMPKATNLVYYHGQCPYTHKNLIMGSMLSRILNLVYTEKIREDEGGSYHVMVNFSLEKYPREEFYVEIMFETDPAKREKLMKIVFDEIEAMATNGPSKNNMNKTKEYMLKQYTDNLKENNFWSGVINSYVKYGLDTFSEQEALINSITIEDIRDFANDLFVKQKNEIEVSMISLEKE